jgi:hypothetical protein
MVLHRPVETTRVNQAFRLPTGQTAQRVGHFLFLKTLPGLLQ